VVVQAAGMWAASRVVLVVFTYFAVLFSFSAHGAQTHLSASAPHPAFTLDALLQTWNRWDAQRYAQIAAHGYDTVANTAFFPLFPLLVALVSFALGNSHQLVAALLVANLSALAAFIAVGLLAAGEDGIDAAGRTIRVLAAYPLAFFLATVYADGLFLALATFSLFCARRGMWYRAALCAFLAALTRPTGAVLVLPLLWEFGRQQGWWRRERWQGGRWRQSLDELSQPGTLARVAALAGAVPLGVGVYAAYLWTRFGHPLIFLYVQGWFWHRVDKPLWWSLPHAAAAFLATPAGTYDQARLLVDLAPLLLCALVTVVTIRRVPFAFTLYMLGVLYLAVAAPMLDQQLGDPDLFVSSGRFLLAAAPIFLVLGRWTARRPWLDLLVVSGGFLLQAVFAAFFLTGGWLV
jgi:hypothetical protein